MYFNQGLLCAAVVLDLLNLYENQFQLHVIYFHYTVAAAKWLCVKIQRKCNISPNSDLEKKKKKEKRRYALK